MTPVLTFLSHIPIKLAIVMSAFDAQACTQTFRNLAIKMRITIHTIMTIIRTNAVIAPGFIMCTQS
jgi:hypothetical protein